MGTREVGTASGLTLASPDSAGSPGVFAVSQSRRHGFSKQPQLSIQLIAGLGAEGDAHLGTTVQHRSRKRWNPHLPNLRQVHLVHAELFAELAGKGFSIGPGDIGENITTVDLDLLALPACTRLHLGATAIVEVTGLRNPCIQMDRFLPGLMAATLDHDSSGALIRKAGVMSIVLASGEVHAGDPIRVELPPMPHRALAPV